MRVSEGPPSDGPRSERPDDADRGDSGVVYVEFLMAFLPLLLLFLGVAQLVLLFGGRLLVHHAAVRATRAASVIVDDDPLYYGGEARGALDGRPAAPEDLLHLLSNANIGTQTGELGAGLARPLAPSRRAEIEASAALVLLPLADRGDATLAGAIGSEGLPLQAVQVLERLDVTFPGHETEPTEPDDLITVRVAFRYPCSVPLARRLICVEDQSAYLLESQMRLPVQGAGELEYEEWEP